MKGIRGIDQSLFGRPREGGGGIVEIACASATAGVGIGVSVYMNQSEIGVHFAERP